LISQIATSNPTQANCEPSNFNHHFGHPHHPQKESYFGFRFGSHLRRVNEGFESSGEAKPETLPR
jgi:hypothetical protein